MSMIVPIWRAVLPLAAFAGGGAILDRAFGLELTGGRTLRAALTTPAILARWVLCGLVATFAVALHPLVFGAMVGLALLARVTRRTGPSASKPGVLRSVLRNATEDASRVARHNPWVTVAALALGAFVLLRPAAFLYWDSFIWLGKARIESAGWGALRAAALDRSADIIPGGYPLLWSLAASWLSMAGTTMDALAAGAAALTLLALVLFLDAIADAFGSTDDGRASQVTARPPWAIATLGLVACTPIVFVHLRSAYVDLPVGLLAATCMLRLARSFERREPPVGDVAVAAICAAMLAGMKDEGAFHVAAIVASVVLLRLSSGERLPLRRAVAVLGAATVPFAGWRILLAAHHVTDGDHRLSAPDLGATGAIGRTVLHHLGDTRSWGALWPITAACVVLVLVRRGSFRPATRLAAIALLGEAAILGAALVFGPSRVREFAFAGTLVNRLLLQLVPPVGVVLTLAVGDAAAAWASVRRSLERPARHGLDLPPPPSSPVPASVPVPVLTRSSPDSRYPNPL